MAQGPTQDERELVATARGALVIWLLLEAQGSPVHVSALARAAGVTVLHMRYKVLPKIECANVPLYWPDDVHVALTLPLKLPAMK